MARMLRLKSAVTLSVAAIAVALCFTATSALAAEDPNAARERLCGSKTDCLTVVVVEEVPDNGQPINEKGAVGGEDPEVTAALAMQEAKDAEHGVDKQNRRIKRVPRSFLKIDRLNFKTDTVVQMVGRMPEWFGPRPAKFVFRGKEVPITKRLSRFNPRLNEKIIMIAADEHDEPSIVVPKTEENSPKDSGAFDL